MLKAWLELARISNLPTAWTNVLAGWLLAGGQLQDQRLLWLLLGGSLLYSGGMILNDAADAGYDREHRKERPIPRGAVSVGAAWVGGLICLVIGWIACIRGFSNVWLSIGLVVVILAYDLYHKPWPGSVAVMGLCRTFLYLVAGWPGVYGAYWLHQASLIEPISCFVMFPSPLLGEGRVLLIASLAIGAYIVALTMIARMEGRGGSPKKGAMWFSKLLLYSPGIVAAARVFTGGDPRVLILLLAFAVLIAVASRMMKRGGSEIGRAVGILLAGIAVVDGLAVATISFPLACGFVALAPLLRLWQRKIAAT